MSKNAKFMQYVEKTQGYVPVKMQQVYNENKITFRRNKITHAPTHFSGYFYVTAFLQLI